MYSAFLRDNVSLVIDHICTVSSVRRKACDVGIRCHALKILRSALTRSLPSASARDSSELAVHLNLATLCFNDMDGAAAISPGSFSVENKRDEF